MSTIANITNTTGEFINRITDLDIGITITTSLLSIIGACVIFLTFALKWKKSETDRVLMTFLVCLTVADLFIALGYLIGATRFIGSDDSHSIPTRVLACHKGKEPGCITQSFITTMFSMCSFFWTTVIAFNLWLPYVMTSSTDHNNIIRFPGINKKTIIFYHAISWGIPAVITIDALCNNALGSDLSVGSGAWCWISACLTDTERTIWMTVSGKGWEILMYFMCCGFYVLLKVFKWKQQKMDKRAYLDSLSVNKVIIQRPNEDIRFLFLWLLELSLRISGTIRFIMATIRRHTGYSSVYYNKVDIVLLHIQSFGDSAQALCSCIVFCILRSNTLHFVKSVINRLRRKNEECTSLLNLPANI